MLKKTSFIFCLSALALFLYSRGTRKNNPDTQRGWKKFTKNKTGLKVGKVKKSDLVVHKLPIEKRTPASVKTSRYPKRDGRYLQGKDARTFENPNAPLHFKNRVGANWKENLGNNLTRFHPEGTEVLIKKEKGIIHLYKGIAHYREQVLISYKKIDGSKSSYRAIVDSSNGKIIYTYDRTIIENFRRGASAGLTHPHFSN